MATSKNPSSPADAGRPPPGVESGARPDLSGSMPPPKASAKSKVKTKPAEGKSAEGLSTAKPLPKPKPKGPASGAAAGAAPSGDVAPSAAGESRQPPPSSGGDGAGQPPGTTGASSGRSAAPKGERLSDEERQRRIAEAAYRKAQERGFGDDRQLDDWLEAEREIERGAGG